MRFNLRRINEKTVEIDFSSDSTLALGDLFEISSRRYQAILIRIESEFATLLLIEPVSSFISLTDSCIHIGNDLIIFTPDLINNGAYDGLLRNLRDYTQGISIPYGLELSRNRITHRIYNFIPTVEENTMLTAGQPFGYVTVQDCRIYSFVPEIEGSHPIRFNQLEEITDEVSFASWGPHDLTLRTRLYLERSPSEFNMIDCERPVISTGLRCPDMLFPVFEGTSLAVAGGFGTGKSSLMVYLMNNLPFDVIIYSACGERGNEIIGLLEELEQQQQIRTIVIANTSDMSSLLRSRALFISQRIGLHLSRMGLRVLLIADSTSRWAEALRENINVLNQTTGESGYPSNIFSQLGRYYNVAGIYNSPVGQGSLTLFSIISPPGGDMSEPVVQTTLQFVKTVWFLNPKLREKRHFPTIDWRLSYINDSANYYNNLFQNQPNRANLLTSTQTHLHTHYELQQIIQLFGESFLTPQQKINYFIPGLIIDFFLKQSFSSTTGFVNNEEAESLLTFINFIYDQLHQRVREGYELVTSESCFEELKSLLLVWNFNEMQIHLSSVTQILSQYAK